MTLVLQWVPQAPSAGIAPAAVVGPPGIREAAQARADGLIPADTSDDQLSAVYAAYLASGAAADAAEQLEEIAAIAGAAAAEAAIVPVAEKADAALPASELNAALAALALGGGVLASGVWTAFGRLPRLRLTGTGSVSLDARNRLGAVVSNVAAYTVAGATNQIEFPYFGDDAVEVRAALTGTAVAEII